MIFLPLLTPLLSIAQMAEATAPMQDPERLPEEIIAEIMTAYDRILSTKKDWFIAKVEELHNFYPRFESQPGLVVNDDGITEFETIAIYKTIIDGATRYVMVQHCTCYAAQNACYDFENILDKKLEKLKEVIEEGRVLTKDDFMTEDEENDFYDRLADGEDEDDIKNTTDTEVEQNQRKSGFQADLREELLGDCKEKLQKALVFPSLRALYEYVMTNPYATRDMFRKASARLAELNADNA